MSSENIAVGDSGQHLEHAVDTPQTTNNNTSDSHGKTCKATGLDLSGSRTVSHLTTYPTVNAVVHYAAANAVIKMFLSSAVPLVLSVHEKSKPLSDPVMARAAPYVTKADEFGNQVLNRIDEKIPALKQKQPQELADVASRPVDSVKRRVSATGRAVNENLVRPVKDLAWRGVSNVSSAYDTESNAYIKRRVDSVISPVNSRLEHLVERLVPPQSQSNTLSNEPSRQHTVPSNEFGRSYRIVSEAWERARPLILQEVGQLSSLPSKVRKHVTELYTARLTQVSGNRKPELGDSVHASLSVLRDLTHEGIALATNAISKVRSSSTTHSGQEHPEVEPS